MDSEETKQQLLRDFEAATVTQAEEKVAAESRSKIFKSRIQYFFASAIVGSFFGWIAFIVGKMYQMSFGIHIPIAAIFGAALALIYSIRKHRVLRNESLRIRHVRPAGHPNSPTCGHLKFPQLMT